jgi:uncharacterized protein (TIGR02391 family)
VAAFSEFDAGTLRAICNVLADTYNGLSGSEIEGLLSDCGIQDPSPGSTKRHRLFEALYLQQQKYRTGNHTVRFVVEAMKPVRYAGIKEVYEQRRAELNGVLLFVGLELGEDGKIREAKAARTLSEAEERASRLRKELSERKVHPDVLRFCRKELLQDNYFHAVFEATKSVADKIREKSGLSSDGSILVDEAFRIKAPLLAFNSLQTEPEKSEHKGLMHLLKGLFGTFRNTTAHAPKIKWVIDEQDALDMLSLASLLHRRLDEAVRTHYNPPE